MPMMFADFQGLANTFMSSRYSEPYQSSRKPTVTHREPMLGLNPPNLSDKGDSSAKRSLSAQVLFLLQHITTTTYVSVSDRLVNTVNGSAPVDCCWTLRIDVRHIRRTATVHPHLASLLARLCLRIAEQLSPEVCDENTQDMQGKGLSGSQLLRKYLLNGCQLAFEIRLAAHGLVETAEFDGEDGKDSEAADAWCAMVQEAKNQGPGLARFLGELFKIGLLPMRVVHECVRALLPTSREEPLDFRPVEDACVLLSSAGGMMDIPKARELVDAYLARIESMIGHSQCPLRVRAMWKEIIDLRAQRWITAPDAHNAEAVYKKGIFNMAGFGTSTEQDYRDLDALTSWRRAEPAPHRETPVVSNNGRRVWTHSRLPKNGSENNRGRW